MSADQIAIAALIAAGIVLVIFIGFAVIKQIDADTEEQDALVKAWERANKRSP